MKNYDIINSDSIFCFFIWFFHTIICSFICMRDCRCSTLHVLNVETTFLYSYFFALSEPFSSGVLTDLSQISCIFFVINILRINLSGVQQVSAAVPM